MAEQNIRVRILSYMIAAAAGSALTFILVHQEADRKQPDEHDIAEKSVPVVQVPKIPVIPAPPPPLDRAALLKAAADAADAVASGSALPKANAALTGQSFILRLPFGCSGEMSDGDNEGSWAGWTYNPKSRALKLTARPSEFAEADWVKQIAEKMTFDAVEGFWIRRPWTRMERCGEGMGALTDSAPDVPAQRLAIAQFYSPEGSRTLRRGDRPYSSTVKLEEGLAPSSTGYQIQLEGKLSGFPDGQPIHCAQDSPAVPPRCLIAVQFTRVAFVSPSAEDAIVEWR